MGRRPGGLLLLTCPWGLCSHAVLAFSMTAPAMTVSPLGNGLSSCLHSSCMTEASRLPGPAAAASTSPGSSSKSFPGPGGWALSVQSLFHGGDAGPGPGRRGPQGSPWAVYLCVQLCCALEDEQEEKCWAPEQGGVSLQTGRLFLYGVRKMLAAEAGQWGYCRMGGQLHSSVRPGKEEQK